MKKKMLLFCSLLFYVVGCSFEAAAKVSNYMAAKQKREVKRHLSRLNKPALKSIKSPDGDIIDCVHISKQPAFDHPFLKSHTIQMRPNYHPEGLFGESKMGTLKAKMSNSGAKPITQLWHSKGECPRGTIPIRRTKKADVLRASSIKSYGKKKLMKILSPNSANVDDIQNAHQHAIAYVEGEYNGAKARLNVWQPKIQQVNEFSLSQIWVLGGSFSSDLNSIEAGWQVSPELYGDNNARLFTYWTSDAYQGTGCYNLLCSGFIQVNNKIAMGASISPVSAYRDSQYDISLLIWKDPNKGHWWMQYGDGPDGLVLGYWPSFLFPYLANNASMIQWGGEVVNTQSDGQHTTTQMGSGQFPEKGFGKSSYFRNIQVVDASNNLRAPKDISTFTDDSNCYDVLLGKNDDWGNYFYYGGPGRNPDCP